MSNIYYFNINYYCNNDCIYCFSSSTGIGKREISLETFKRIISNADPASNDKIIINGGEPSLHKQFYKIIKWLIDNYNSEIVIYTNGRNISLKKYPSLKKVRFVIPIHGNKIEHNYITQNEKSYSETLETLKQLELLDMNYVVKFIINNEMIRKAFNPMEFLNEHNLLPDEIIIARLNETKKSKANEVSVVGEQALKGFLSVHSNHLNRHFKVKYLDLPFCYFNEVIEVKTLPCDLPVFYFSDDQNYLVKRNYFKDVKIGNKCKSCKYEQLCDIMKKSYLTLYWNDCWSLEIE